MTLHEVRERTSSQLRVLLKQNEGCVWVSDQPSIQEDKQRWTRIVGVEWRIPSLVGVSNDRYADPGVHQDQRMQIVWRLLAGSHALDSDEFHRFNRASAITAVLGITTIAAAFTPRLGRKGDGKRRYRDPRKEGCNLQDG
jgi:hypothetical protein